MIHKYLKMVLFSQVLLAVVSLTGQVQFQVEGVNGLNALTVGFLGDLTINTDNDNTNFDLRIIDYDPNDHARIRLHNLDNADFWDIEAGGINNNEFSIYSNVSGRIMTIKSSGKTQFTDDQAIVELQSNGNVSGSSLDLNNVTAGPFNLMGAINFRNGAISPGQIAYTSTSQMKFKVNSIDAFMTLKDGTNHIEMSNGAVLTSSGVWTNAPVPPSLIRNEKASIDYHQILSNLGKLPLYQWEFGDESPIRHMGPTPKDFYKAFGCGVDDQRIAPSDLAAVSLAAIKALNQENIELRNEIAYLKSQVDEIINLLHQNKKSLSEK